MSLNADLQVLTQPGATGNQTYSLAANFDPKAIILWATPQTADGSVASYRYGIGLGTYRGAAVQQRYVCIRGLDGAGSADTARGAGSGALLVIQTSSAGASSRDLEIDLVSMQTGATSEVVLNWVNLHSTASIRVFMLVLGGSDITDAIVEQFTVTTAAATQDEEPVAGFGKPDFLFFINLNDADSEAASDAIFSFGFAKQGEAGRCFAFAQTDGNTASITAMTQRSNRFNIAIVDGGGSTESIAALDTNVANWPTDGFKVDYDSTPSFANRIGYLALRGTFQSTTGANTAPTAGGLPVNQDNNAGFVPKVGFNLGWNLAASASIQTADATQCGFGIGAYDGTTEAWAGFTEDDAAGTMDSNSQQSTAKSIRNYNQAAALQSEADGAFSGNNYRLSWNDIDSVAREYQWFALGNAAGGAFELSLDPGGYALTGSVAGLLAARALNAEPGAYSLSGLLASLDRGFLLNAEAGSYALTGAATTLIADRLLSADAGTYTLTGNIANLLADRILSADPGVYSVTGAEAELVFISAGAFELNLEPGVYALTGSDAGVLADRILSLDAGVYVVTGISADLVFSGAGVVPVKRRLVRRLADRVMILGRSK